MFEKDIECFWNYLHLLSEVHNYYYGYFLGFVNSLTTRIFPILEHDSNFVDADLVEVVE